MSAPALLRPLATERFLLEPLGRWRSFQESRLWLEDPEILRNYTGSAERPSLRRWWRKGPRANGRTRFVHAIRPHGGPIVGLHLMDLKPWRSADLAVVIHDRAWWGQDVVREARGALIAHALEHGAAERFSGYVNARNFASIFNYRRLGFRHAGTLRRMRADPIGGEVHDLLIFELLREDWKGWRTPP